MPIDYIIGISLFKEEKMTTEELNFSASFVYSMLKSDLWSLEKFVQWIEYQERKVQPVKKKNKKTAWHSIFKWYNSEVETTTLYESKNNERKSNLRRIERSYQQNDRGSKQFATHQITRQNKNTPILWRINRNRGRKSTAYLSYQPS